MNSKRDRGPEAYLTLESALIKKTRDGTLGTVSIGLGGLTKRTVFRSGRFAAFIFCRSTRGGNQVFQLPHFCDQVCQFMASDEELIRIPPRSSLVCDGPSVMLLVPLYG
jgi:hypothetical protein